MKGVYASLCKQCVWGVCARICVHVNMCACLCTSRPWDCDDLPVGPNLFSQAPASGGLASPGKRSLLRLLGREGGPVSLPRLPGPGGFTEASRPRKQSLKGTQKQEATGRHAYAFAED